LLENAGTDIHDDGYLITVAQSLPASGDNDWNTFAKRYSPPRDVLLTALEAVDQEGHGEALGRLANLFDKLYPGDPLGISFLSRAAYLNGEYLKSAELLESLMEQVDKETWQNQYAPRLF